MTQPKAEQPSKPLLQGFKAEVVSMAQELNASSQNVLAAQLIGFACEPCGYATETETDVITTGNCQQKYCMTPEEAIAYYRSPQAGADAAAGLDDNGYIDIWQKASRATGRGCGTGIGSSTCRGQALIAEIVDNGVQT